MVHMRALVSAGLGALDDERFNAASDRLLSFADRGDRDPGHDAQTAQRLDDLSFGTAEGEGDGWWAFPLDQGELVVPVVVGPHGVAAADGIALLFDPKCPAIAGKLFVVHVIACGEEDVEP